MIKSNSTEQKEELFFCFNRFFLLFLFRSIRPQLSTHHNTSPPGLYLNYAVAHMILVLLLSSECLLLREIRVDEFLIIAILQQIPYPVSIRIYRYILLDPSIFLRNKCVLYEIHGALRNRVSS